MGSGKAYSRRSGRAKGSVPRSKREARAYQNAQVAGKARTALGRCPVCGNLGPLREPLPVAPVQVLSDEQADGAACQSGEREFTGSLQRRGPIEAHRAHQVKSRQRRRESGAEAGGEHQRVPWQPWAI